MSKYTNKKSIFILVACLMLALVVFTACVGAEPFEPTITDGISGQTPASNGGIAVQYGDYIYYVNGHQSSNSVSNDYTNEIRTGSIVRIKASAIDDIISINDDTSKASEITERIATAVQNNVELVVPCYYYSTNTTNKNLTGLYIFNDRLYITTPNQTLTDGGSKKINQLVLESYKLDGSDRQQHYVFVDEAGWDTSTTGTQIMLSQVNADVYATFLLNGDINSLKVGEATASVIAEDVTSVNFDSANNVVFYLDEDGNVCNYVAGATEGVVLVNKETANNNGEHDYTYTISFVSDGTVYYTRADANNSTYTDETIFYANATANGVVINATLDNSSTIAYNNKLLRVRTETHNDTTAKTYYVEALYIDGETLKADVLFESRYEVTLSKVENGILYFVEENVTYKRDLNSATPTNEAYALNLASASSQGWDQADVIGKYTFAFGSGTVTVTSFDGVKTNSTATNITLVAEEE